MGGYLFLDCIYRIFYKKKRTLRFGTRICFRPQVKKENRVPTQLHPKERANLNYFSNPDSGEMFVLVEGL